MKSWNLVEELIRGLVACGAESQGNSGSFLQGRSRGSGGAPGGLLAVGQDLFCGVFQAPCHLFLYVIPLVPSTYSLYGV